MSLTLHEQKMLDRLTKAGVLHWTSIRADDTRTLNRLVKKGAAFETVGRARRRRERSIVSTKAKVWWQLAWSLVRSHPGEYRGAVTHAMTDDGALACGRTLLAPETGATSDDEESTEPSCRQCRRKLGMDLTPANPDAQQADSAGGVVGDSHQNTTLRASDGMVDSWNN